jgi:hypothetical protein
MKWENGLLNQIEMMVAHGKRKWHKERTDILLAKLLGGALHVT